MRIRSFHSFVVALLICTPLAAPATSAAAADMGKVLRISSNDITSLDPQQGTDLYSTRITSAIFEGLYEFEYLSTGSKVVPNTAESMPVVSDDGKTWTIKLKPGKYTYQCDVHLAQGMKGTFKVTK